MAKQGMKRYYPSHSKNEVRPVPEISGNAKSGKAKARHIIPDPMEGYKVFHSVPHEAEEIPPVFSAIDNDLAAENMENDFDMTGADLQDLKEH